jgi:hypothetical protein
MRFPLLTGAVGALNENLQFSFGKKGFNTSGKKPTGSKTENRA